MEDRRSGHRLVVFSTLHQQIFENLIISDLYKTYLHRGAEPPLFHWRTVTGSEVDVVMETQSGLIPMEIKLSETPRPEMAKEILAFQRDFKKKGLQGYAIHPGTIALPLGQSVTALPLNKLWKLYQRMDITTALHAHFGFDPFRSGQEEAIQSLLNRQLTSAETYGENRFIWDFRDAPPALTAVVPPSACRCTAGETITIYPRQPEHSHVPWAL